MPAVIPSRRESGFRSCAYLSPAGIVYDLFAGWDLSALVGLAIGFTVPTFAQQKDTVDPKTAQQIRALSMKYDEAFNRNDAAAVAALYTEDGVQVFRGTSHGRQAIEKSYSKYDFQRWHFNNRLITIDRLNGIGNEVRAIGRWSDTAHDEPYPSSHDGHFTWILVREGDTWKIHRSTFSDSTSYSTN
jgi:uncharacterized protein (TIGR02246 family)